MDSVQKKNDEFSLVYWCCLQTEDCLWVLENCWSCDHVSRGWWEARNSPVTDMLSHTAIITRKSGANQTHTRNSLCPVSFLNRVARKWKYRVCCHQVYSAWCGKSLEILLRCLKRRNIHMQKCCLLKHFKTLQFRSRGSKGNLADFHPAFIITMRVGYANQQY